MNRILNFLAGLDTRSAIGATVLLLGLGGIIGLIVLFAQNFPQIATAVLATLVVAGLIGALWFVCYVICLMLFDSIDDRRKRM